MHTIGFDFALSSQCDYDVVLSIVWLCLIFLDNSDTRMQWTEVFELLLAWWLPLYHNDLCYPPSSWNPLLTFITDACPFCPTCELWGRSNSVHNIFKISWRKAVLTRCQALFCVKQMLTYWILRTALEGGYCCLHGNQNKNHSSDLSKVTHINTA